MSDERTADEVAKLRKTVKSESRWGRFQRRWEREELPKLRARIGRTIPGGRRGLP